MSRQIQELSPLSEFHSDNTPDVSFKQVKLSELAFLGHFNIRIQPDDELVLKEFKQSLGFDVPREPNTFVVHDDILCAWLGPDEWLVISPQHRSEEIRMILSKVTSEGFSTCVDQSSAPTIIRVEGRKATDLLSRGIAIDLHPRVFKSSQCAQTVLARTAVTILKQEADETTLDVIVRRSFADYLWRWLVDADQEAEFRE